MLQKLSLWPASLTCFKCLNSGCVPMTTIRKSHYFQGTRRFYLSYQISCAYITVLCIPCISRVITLYIVICLLILKTKPSDKSLSYGKDFRIVHYAGEVTYEVEGFIYKNKDTLFQDFKRLMYNRWVFLSSNLGLILVYILLKHLLNKIILCRSLC